MEIIKIKQLPIIEENLLKIKEEVSKKTNEAISLECTEETVKAVKSARSSLNAEFKEWEAKRKEVKTAIMSPYEKFNAIYEKCIADTYKTADRNLKEKVDAVENALKESRKAELLQFFTEYCESLNVDFVSFERANINITLSVSTKKLKEQVRAFVDKVRDDLALIDTQENKAEILVEYKKTLNVSNAITSVAERLKAVEEEKARQEAWKQKEVLAQEAENKVDEVSEPVVMVTPPIIEEPILELNFTVRGTRAKLRELKMFLENGGYEYE